MNTLPRRYAYLSGLLLLLLLFTGCGPAQPPDPFTDGQPSEMEQESHNDSMQDSVADQTTEVGPPSVVRVSGTPSDASRSVDVILKVEDTQGNPVPGVEIEVAQADMDFIYSASGTAFVATLEMTDEGWSFNQEQLDRYNTLGFNNVEYYPWWLWVLAEPQDDQFQFEGVIDDGQFTNPQMFRDVHPQVRFNTFWVGPQFNHTDMVPQWVDYRDDATFREEFEEYITASFNLNPSGHFDLYELGVEINNFPRWDISAWDATEADWDWAIDFLKFEADLIRQLDPAAKISLDFDIVTYFPDCEACILENWIERCIAAGVDFDVIGFEFHPGIVAGEPANVEELVQFLERFEKYDKDYYVWEFSVKSAGTPQIWEYDRDWIPPVERYSEAYQRDLTLDLLDFFIKNPRVLGLRYTYYVDPIEGTDPGEGSDYLVNTGLLTADLEPKLVVPALQAFWRASLFTDSLVTDEQGEIRFSAFPGKFELSLAGKSYPFQLNRDNAESQFELDATNIPAPTASPIQQETGMETLSPCEVAMSTPGDEIILQGKVAFLDEGPDGVFFEMEDQGCRVGVFIMSQIWDGWSDQERSMFQAGNEVMIAGTIVDFQGNLEIELNAFLGS